MKKLLQVILSFLVLPTGLGLITTILAGIGWFSLKIGFWKIDILGQDYTWPYDEKFIASFDYWDYMLNGIGFIGGIIGFGGAIAFILWCTYLIYKHWFKEAE